MALKILCLGAGLQGLEVAGLAMKAGWDLTLVDKRRDGPASGLCKTLKTDLAACRLYDLAALCQGYDLIVPALEDFGILEAFCTAQKQDLIPPLAFDMDAYRISRSKKLSKKTFAALGLPMARDFHPSLPGPFIAKPDDLSGSRGVRYFESALEVLKTFPDPEMRQNLIIEEHLSGPSYSLEVTASKRRTRTWQTTLLGMDDIFDCCRVSAPSGLPPEREKELADIARRLARAVSLRGIMDLEVIDHKNQFKLLEIDARFPSQTPTAVYWSTGVNLLVELAACFMQLPRSVVR
ncbi:MAG: ATP-grasp domain-containing protein, partial [Deltaproteobacteria bacterium]|nr:ATP-grasp domain-containing protein [Deltaproteobacteria bacterium]